MTTMIERSPCAVGVDVGEVAEQLVQRGSSRKIGSPRPCIRTMLGGPWKAHHISVMRPFSRRCAMVSALLPAKSR